MSVRIDYLADEACLPKVADWQHAQFGYLNPAGTLERRATKLRQSLHRDRLPMALAIAADATLVGSPGILASTSTHQHLTPWLSSVFVPGEWRGKGIASALSLRAVEEAGRIGFETLYLFTRTTKHYTRGSVGR